jgi:glycosyltransferase involved in cell wall biosynthesis
VDDLRWFAPNRYCALPVPRLRSAGLGVSLEGDAPARLVVAADAQCAVAAYEHARRHRCPLLFYLWDLPPWRLGAGKPDTLFELGGRLRRIPRVRNRYPERPAYYSRVRHVAMRAVQVWCPSENTVRDVRARFGIEAERVPFCYDSDRFTGVAPARPRDTGYGPVLSVSRLVAHKNQAAILRAAARLDPVPPVHLIGQGPELGSLRRLAVELGVALELSDNRVSDDAVVAAYRAAGVVVAPSRFEGFGLTPLEGLAMGLPVIASDIPPHREFVPAAARFFPPDDDAALAREIAAARANPEELPGRSHVLAAVTIQACVDRFLPRLERLLVRSA